MTEVPPTYRPLPQGTMQAASQISGDVVQGLGKSPLMFGIIILNAFAIFAAVYFLNILIRGQQSHLEKILTTQQAHNQEILGYTRNEMEKIINVHNREFDSLIEIIRALHVPTPAVAGTQATPAAPPPRTGR